MAVSKNDFTLIFFFKLYNCGQCAILVFLFIRMAEKIDIGYIAMYMYLYHRPYAISLYLTYLYRL